MFAGGDDNYTLTLTSVDAGFTSGLRAASSAVSLFEGNVVSALGRLSALSIGVGAITAVAAGFVTASNAAAQVQQNVANLNAVLNATPAQLARVRAESLALSQQSQFTDSQIIAGQQAMARAYMNTAQIIANSRNVVNLAGAAQIDPNQAGQLFAQAQKTFQLGSADATSTVNTLAQALNSSQGSVTDYVTAFKQIGPAANSAHLSLKETTTAVADLTQAGMRGDAGTGIRTFLARIENPSKQAQQAMAQLGLSFYDTQGKMLPLVQIMDELRIKTAGLTQETRDAALNQIFGQRGARVADIYAEEGSSGYAEAAQHMADSGDAAEINARKLDTLQGSVKKLSSSLNVFGVQVGTNTIPQLKSMADVATGAINALTSVGGGSGVGSSLLAGGAAVGLEAFGAYALGGRGRQRAADAAQTGAQQQATSVSALAMQRDAELEAERRYQSAIVQAEFTADSQIGAAHAEMIQKLDTLDAAHTDRVIAAFRSQAAEIRAIYDQQAIAAAESAEKQALAFEKESALLTINQGAARQQLDLQQTSAGFSPGLQLSREQELERSTLEEKQRIQADFDARYATIEEQSVQRRIDAINVAGNEELAALRERAALMRTGYAEAFGAQAAAIQAGEANATAAAEEQLYAGQAAAGAAAQRSGGSAAGRRAVALSVAPTVEEGALASAKGRIAGALGATWGFAGDLVLPVMIAFTVEEAVIQPTVNSYVKGRAAARVAPESTFTDQLLTAGQTGPQTSSAYQRDLATYQADLAYNQRVLAIQQDENTRRASTPIAGGANAFLNKIGIQQTDQVAAATAQQNIDNITASIKHLQDSAANSPDLFKQDEITRGQALAEQVAAGTKTVDEATRQWSQYGSELEGVVGVWESNDQRMRDMGLTEQQIQTIDKQMTESFVQNAKMRQSQIDAETDARIQNRDAMQRAQTLGATDQQVFASVGLDTSGNALTGANARAEQAAATKQVEALAKAWQEAGAAVGQVNIKNGIAGLASDAEALARAQDRLSGLGQDNRELDYLANISSQFKTIADAEDKATAAFNGYLLTLDESDRRVSFLDSFTQKFEGAVDQAQIASANGVATPEQMQLLRERQSIEASISQNRMGLVQNETGDILGMAHNLPDLKQADDLTRSIVDTSGKQIALDVKSNAQDAKDEIDRIVNGPYDTIVLRVKYEIDGAVPPGMPGSGTPNPTDVTAGNGFPGGAMQDNSFGVGYDGGKGITNYGYQGTPIPGGPLGYRSMSYSDYQKMVEAGAGGTSSPFDDPDVYRSFMASAQQNNVDPRLMLTATQYENSNATNISPELNRANNFGGLTWDPNNHAAGAMQGPARPGNEGGYYDAFANPQDFFDALAKNLSTGAYQQDYQAGNVEAIRKRYTPSASQSDLDTFNNTYQQAVRQYPAASGGPGQQSYPYFGDPGDPTNPSSPAYANAHKPWQLPVTNYTITQGPFSGAGNSHESLGAYDLAVPTGTPVRSVGAGRVTESGWSNDGYGNTEVVDYGNGIKARYGHLSDLEGTKVGEQVAAGQEIGKSGSTGNSTGPHLHFEVTVNGKEVDPASVGFNFQDPSKMGAQAATGQSGTQVGTYNAATQGQNQPYIDPKKLPLANISTDADRVRQAFTGVDPQGMDFTESLFNKFQPFTQRNALAALPSTATDYDKQQASVGALQNSLTLEAAVAKYVADIENHTGNTKDDLVQIANINGDIGPWVASQAENWSKIQGATKQVKADQDAITAIDQATTARHQSERAADEQASQQKTKDSWIQQASDHSFQMLQQTTRDGWQDQANALQDRRTKETQGYDEATANENRRHTLVDRNLQDEVRATTKAQQDQRSGTTATENSLRYTMSTATGATRFGAGEQLAIQRDYDTRSLRSNQNVLDTLQQAQILEQRNSEDTIYNLNTQHRIATVGFDKDAHDAQLAQQGVERRWQAETNGEWAYNFKKTQDDTMAQWRLQAQRNSADALDTLNKSIAQAQLDTDKATLDGYTAEGKALDAAFSKWTQLADLVGASGSSLLSVVPTIKTDTSQSSNSVAQAYLNYYATIFPTKALGGKVSGDYAIVGDAPGGDMSSAEVVDFRTRTVIPHSVAASLGMLGGGLPHYASGTGPQPLVVAGGGDTYHISIQASGNETTDAALFAKFRRWADDRDRAQQQRTLGRPKGAMRGSRAA